MSSLLIRPLDHRQDALARALHSVQRTAYTLEAELLGVRHFPPLDRTPSDLQGLEERFFGAFDGERLVGAISIETGEHPNERNISSLVVLPEYQRRGIGRMLLEHALHACGNRPVTVSTGAKNTPALALYMKLGFVEQARRVVGPEALELVKLRRLGRTSVYGDRPHRLVLRPPEAEPPPGPHLTSPPLPASRPEPEALGGCYNHGPGAPARVFKQSPSLGPREGALMKKNVKKLRLHRETLVLLDPKAVSIPFRGAAEARETSCTYPCGCPTGCSDEQACLETGALV